VIENLIVDDLGFNVNYYATIKFNIVIYDKVSYSNTFNSEITESKVTGSDYKKQINALIKNCIEKFISDAQKQNII
jgi:hypothetical protein